MFYVLVHNHHLLADKLFDVWGKTEVFWSLPAWKFVRPPQPLAPICEACGSQKPKAAGSKFKTWSCKFCTLEKDRKLEKCSACDQWRYSYGAPIATVHPIMTLESGIQLLNTLWGSYCLQCKSKLFLSVLVSKSRIIFGIRRQPFSFSFLMCLFCPYYTSSI